MNEWLRDGVAIGAAEFVGTACDPARSCMVEACAGSGKTWLLVARVIRLMLAGAAPGEILAITFTRKAAQEMRERLLRDLAEMAMADETQLVAALVERGLDGAAARAATDAARSLHERVLTADVPIAIETFHAWFGRLLARAPLGAGLPATDNLLEGVGRLLGDAWLLFNARLQKEEAAGERAAYLELMRLVGDTTVRWLLLSFVHRRAEWWSFVGEDDAAAAAARAGAPLRAALDSADVPLDAHPATTLRSPSFISAVTELIDTWQQAPNLESIDEWIDHASDWLVSPTADAALDLRAACRMVLTQKHTPRKALLPGNICAQLPRLAARYAAAHDRITTTLARLLEAESNWRALRVHEFGLRCGLLLLDCYQGLKAQRRALDFTDLEWHAFRLLHDEDHAAYMQARLDARYRHILLDEFQDTNPLQWQVLRAWLAAYEGDGERPTVFAVGDPKQSIYRFRRAEPRIFDAALELLRSDFDAVHLRTNVTRRNSQTVNAVLNAAMPAANPLFLAQHTLNSASGAFVLLPLIEADNEEDEDGTKTDDVSAILLRDVLTTARPEQPLSAHYREGCAIAVALPRWIAATAVGTRPARWSDVLLLVRRRTHLAEIERGLRDGGVPFVSDRGGGLLGTPEADDLIALLQFLVAPFADLKLAHALRSPLFDCTDDDLIRLASTAGENWWQRLTTPDLNRSPELSRALRLLTDWLAAAGVLPVHDLLDRIFFEGDLRRRYAARVPRSLHAQVQANFDAFIELALKIDSGRYPSLPRFIDELRALALAADDEAPDEGAAAQGDAVRICTVHGAKGLEAEIVVLADTHNTPRADNGGVLVVWPPRAPRPHHLSLWWGEAVGRRGSARAEWFDDEMGQQRQEDWNLLYVAATRARQLLMVSGVASKKKLPDTWYTRLNAAAELATSSEAPVASEPVEASPRLVYDFRPAPLPTGVRSPLREETDAMRVGSCWHVLLERAEPDAQAPDVGAIAHEFELTPDQAQQAHSAARAVLGSPGLRRFFARGVDPAAEIDVIDAAGELHRIDRLAEVDGTLWVLDYKWQLLDSERAGYEKQIRRYCDVVRSIRSDVPVRGALVLSDGSLIEVDTIAGGGPPRMQEP